MNGSSALRQQLTRSLGPLVPLAREFVGVRLRAREMGDQPPTHWALRRSLSVIVGVVVVVVSIERIGSPS